MTLRILGAVLLAMAAGIQAGQAAENKADYCSADENAEWSAMAEKHEGSNEWQRLYALRLGLCELVDQERLTVNRANEIFENQRSQVLRQFRREAAQDAIGA